MTTRDAVAIYGATGRLGGLVSRDLAAAGVPLRLGGRDPGRLALAGANLPVSVVRHATPIDDPSALRGLLAGCRVVVNAAPIAVGESLAAAAIDAGVHYVDAAGSQPFIGRIFDHHGPAAARQGVALAPSFGLDCALGDCLARLAARGREPAREVVVAYAIAGADVGSNSLQHAAETPGGGEVLFEQGQWRPLGFEIFRRSIEFPPPFGRQPMARYGAGEVVTVPRHTRTEAVTALITASSLVPHPALVPWFPYLRPAVAVARRTPARHLLGLALRLRPSPAPGPAPSASRPPRFAIVVLVEGEDGSRSRGVIEGGDYHRVTAATLAAGARALLSPSFEGRGALPPSSVVDPAALLDGLRDVGVTWAIRSTDTAPRTP